jgi:hypothetical protein
LTGFDSGLTNYWVLVGFYAAPTELEISERLILQIFRAYGANHVTMAMPLTRPGHRFWPDHQPSTTHYQHFKDLPVIVHELLKKFCFQETKKYDFNDFYGGMTWTSRINKDLENIQNRTADGMCQSERGCRLRRSLP